MTPLTLKASGLLGFVAMSIIGWNLSSGGCPPVSDNTTLIPVTKRADRPTILSRASGPVAIAREKMEAIHAAATPAARLRATIDLANSLSPAEFAAWIDGDYFDFREGADLMVFNNLLNARWKEEDAEGLVLWAFKNDPSLSRSIFTSWSETDPQRVIKFFESHPNDQQEMNVLQWFAKAHPALALQRFQQKVSGGISKEVMGGASDFLRQLAENSPEALETAFDSLPPELQKQAQSELIGQRLKASFSSEIRKLWDRPDGWEIFKSNSSEDRSMAGNIFDELANIPPAWRASLAESSNYFIDASSSQKWFDADLVGYGFSESDAKGIRGHALYQFLASQPEEVFKRLDKLEPKLREWAITNAIRSASDEPEKVETLIALLTSEADRNFARASIEEKKADDSDEEKTETPAQILDYLAKDRRKEPEGHIAVLMDLEDMGEEKIAAINAEFKAMPDDKKRKVAEMIAGMVSDDRLEPTLAGEAIRYLVVNPIEASAGAQTNPVLISSTFATRLAVEDPAAGADWIQTLPEGEAKLWARKNLAANWAQYDPKAVDQWVNSLPSDARTEVQAYLSKGK